MRASFMPLPMLPPYRLCNLRLAHRLGLGFGTLVVLMMIVVALASLQFRALAEHSEAMIRHDLKRMLQVQEIDQHVQGHVSAMARLLTSPRSERERIYPVVDEEYAAIDALIGELAQGAAPARAAAALAEVAQRRNQYRDAFVEIVTELEAGDLPRASAMFNDVGQTTMRALRQASKALLEGEQAALNLRQGQVQAQIRQSEGLLGALALAALVASVWLAWRTTVSVAQPLATVEAAAGQIADGNYGVRVPLHAHNELGRVAQAMNTMAAAVAAREAEIENVAYVDRLTGLHNRTSLRRLASAGHWRQPTVLLLDLARLRTVNEVLGFETGDALLLQIARRLATALAAERAAGAPPVLARLPGGVFAVVSEGLDRPAAEALRARLEAALTHGIAFDGHAVDVHLVAGLADADGLPEAERHTHHVLDVLLQRAELAASDAKRQRRPWAWHGLADDVARARQLNLLSTLRQAAAAGELEMWLQPKQCLRSGRTLGMEGLVRWRHAERGYVSPSDFIAFAERTGHIGVVTQAMLEAAMKTLAAWAPVYPELSLAVNVSALDVRDADFPQRVAQLARRLHAPLDKLRLEITESTVMEDPERVLAVLHALRALGVQLSIDDFGTGYSSLAYLQRLPVSELKIDRSFVSHADRRPESRALLRTIIELGHSLKMEVTAEGIERPEEAALLAGLGCDVAQGFLISKPLAPQAVERYLRSRVGEPQALVPA